MFLYLNHACYHNNGEVKGLRIHIHYYMTIEMKSYISIKTQEKLALCEECIMKNKQYMRVI